MSSRVVQYFSDLLKMNKEYPITITKAIYNENGKRLDDEMLELYTSMNALSTKISNINTDIIKLRGGIEDLAKSGTNVDELLKQFDYPNADIKTYTHKNSQGEVRTFNMPESWRSIASIRPLGFDFPYNISEPHFCIFSFVSPFTLKYRIFDGTIEIDTRADVTFQVIGQLYHKEEK